jgi:hypothetical protein
LNTMSSDATSTSDSRFPTKTCLNRRHTVSTSGNSGTRLLNPLHLDED